MNAGHPAGNLLVMDAALTQSRPIHARLPMTRRALLGVAGGSAALALGGCSIGGKDAAPIPVEPTEILSASPTPSQPPISGIVTGYTDPARWKDRNLTVAAWGGDYQEAQDAAFFQPFSAATGATIQTEVADLETLRNQVDSGEVTWDLMTFPIDEVIELSRAGLLSEIDYRIVDQTDLFEEACINHGVGAAWYSTAIIYSNQAHPVAPNWADFWNVTPPEPDVELAPDQVRSLRHSPVGTLEFALIADGVARDELYPLDVDRALASLDRIRENVLVWWQESKEPIELLAIGQADLVSGWNVRLDQLDLAGPLQVQWEDGMLSADAWVIPKGAPNIDLAMDFINFATRPIPSANFARLISYGPVNRGAFDLLWADRLPFLPTSPANKERQFVLDWTYWVDNREELTARFDDWLLGPVPEASPEP